MSDPRAGRGALKDMYGDLYERVEEILFRHDPVGINFGDNRDEYDPEVDTILPRLKRCESVVQVRDVVFEEFARWFDGIDIGPREHYAKAAEEIWAAYLDYHGRDPELADTDSDESTRS